MDRQRVSFTLGRRLRELREERDLSHVELIKQLNEKYGVSISRDSIMAYEISDESRAKAEKLPNMGMRIETLYCLADFCGVSLDYLLGKTNVPHPNIDVREICEKTGISEGIALFLMQKIHVEEFNSFFGGYTPLPFFVGSLYGLHNEIERAKKLCSECQYNFTEDHSALIESRLKIKYERFNFLDDVIQRIDTAYGYQETEIELTRLIDAYYESQNCDTLDDNELL